MRKEIIEETKQQIIMMLLSVGEISLLDLHKNFPNAKHKKYISMAIDDLTRNNIIKFDYAKLNFSTVISLAND